MNRMRFGLSVMFVFLAVLLNAQSMKHPIIFVTAEERAQVLEKIENYSWAQSLVDQLHNKVDAKLATHQINPNSILASVPAFASNDQNSEAESSSLAGAHNSILTQASYAGFLYYITEDEKYAQYAADILAYYSNVLSKRTVANTTICGNYFYDPRTTYPHFAVAYDFIYNFLKQPETKVYSQDSSKYVSVDHTKLQKAIVNIAGNALDEAGGSDTHGKRVSNHPVLTAPGALFPILCVEDDTERERLFNVFWTLGTKRQNSFTKTILPMFGTQGIWPETTSYGFMPNVTLILNVVDKIKPELNVAQANTKILHGNFLFDNLRHPNRRFVTYGDSHRDNDGTEYLYRYTWNMAARRGFDELVEQAQIALKQSYGSSGYSPEISTGKFDNYTAYYQLAWNSEIPDSIVGSIDFQKPTVIIEHAGVALQRNYVKKNNVEYGLCGIIGGAHYVHSHLTGITMELYGNGYIMSPNAGLPASLAERKIPLHTDYFRLYAGNNTVIVNGTSHGSQSGAWNSNSYLWQNTTVNSAAEPKHLQEPINDQFSFATQFLDDNVNNCDQQRTLSTIRTSETTAYYFDMFRSKSNTVNNFHDYIYHNLGDATNITDAEGTEFEFTETDRYNNDIGDPVHSPGWRFFENTKATEATSKAVKVRFDINAGGKYMHMFWPGGTEREFTKAVAPATREAKSPYISRKTQVLAVRKKGEAWNKPFMVVLEPKGSTTASVKSVSQIVFNNKVVGAVVKSEIGQKVVTDYVLCNDGANQKIEVPEENIEFTGRFAVVRKEEQNQTQRFSLYIGEGQELSCYNSILQADEKNRGFLMAGELDTTYIQHDIEIEAEDYDEGGEGVAYHDRESTFYGTAGDYREKGGVDLSTSANASNKVAVSRVRPEEWLNYTFNVDKKHAYYFGIRASNKSYATAAVNAYLNDSLIVENLNVSVTGSLEKYETSEALTSFVLDSGKHTIRVHIVKADFNLDKIMLRKDMIYTAVTPIKEKPLKVYPNPSKDYITIEMNHDKPARYKLFNLNGSLVMQGDFNTRKTLYWNNDLQGIYLLEIVANKEYYFEKVSIQKA